MLEKLSVKKPYTILVMVVVIIMLGVVTLSGMTTDLLPRINIPYILVVTTYPGASPEKVETTICEPMESALGSVKGVKNVYSISNENYGIVELEFVDGTDMDATMVKVSSALDPIKDVLPEECGTPQLMELGTDMLASLYVAVSYDGMDQAQLTRFVEDTVVPRLERQDGVTSISKVGLVEKTVQVELNEEKVNALNDKILAKTDEAFAEALEDLEEAKKSLVDGQGDINENIDKLNENAQKLEDSKQDLVDGQKELEDGKKELADKQADLNQAKQDLEDGKKELQEKKDETYEKLAEASEKLDQLASMQARLSQLQGTVAALPEQISQIDAGITQIDQALNTYGLTELQNQIDACDKAISYVQEMENSLSTSGTALTETKLDMLKMLEQNVNGLTGLSTNYLSVLGNSHTETDAITALDQLKGDVEAKKAQANARVDYFNQSLAQKENLLATKETLTNTLSQAQVEIAGLEAAVSAAEAELKKAGMSYQDIEEAKMQAAAGFGSADAQMVAGEAQLESGQIQLDSAKDQLKDAQKQIDDGWKSIDDAKEQLDDGWDQLKDAQKQIDEGWDSYNDGVKQYEKQRAQAMKKANANQLISLDTLSKLIYAQNFAMPAGYVDDKNDHAWLVKVGDNYESLEELEQVLLTKIDDVGDVRLCDVADLSIIDNAEDSYAKLDRKDAVILSIFKSSTSGTNEVSKQCKAEIAAMEEEFPGLHIFPLMDQGDYITLIVNSVLKNIIIGAVLAIFVLAIFLKDVKPTLVVAASIPLSVLTALILMYFTDISLNMMSLSGLALGIGMLVDNSIVVIENIYRLRSKGVGAARAAVQGTKQVAGAIIASTLTTVCVFFPMVFTSGTVRELIMPISLTIIFTLGASLLISMTVVPAAGSTLLRNAKEKKHPWFEKIQNFYGKSLSFFLRFKIIPLAIAIGLLALCIWQVARMGIVMFPDMSSSQIQASVTMPEEWDRDTCYKTADEILSRIENMEGVGTVGAMSGGDASLFSSAAASNSENYDTYSIMITMANANAGSKEVSALCDAIEDSCKELGCEVSVSSGMNEMSSMMGGTGLGINIYGDDLDTLKAIGEDITALVNTVDGFAEVTNGEEDLDQVVHLVIDKDAAMRYGLSVAQMFNDINTKISSTATAATVTIDGEEMDIVIVDERAPLTKENLLDYNFELEVTDEDGDTILEDHTLGEFAKAEIRDGVASINRKNQSRYITLTALPEEGENVTLLSRELEPLLEQYQVPDGYTVEVGGEYDAVMTMVSQMVKVLALGLALIYLVMVAQFQSLLSPFIVIFTVPLAFTGGLLGLWGAGETLSITGLLGFVILMGTVVNNGIVFVDYANQLRIGGMKRRDALIVTGKTRMRPILMTAMTTILAMSTMLFGDDMANQMSRGMVIVIIGGLVYATFMTLYIIPVMYDILFRKQPVNVDLGDENLDDEMDDAADYIASLEATE